LQVPLMHGVPDVQQGSPEPPHSVHWDWVPTVLQTVPDVVHTLPEQQGSPSLPHDSQNPLVVHTWVAAAAPHAWPGPTHVDVLPWLSQHPPLLH
jgi:hypothetical protein